MVDQAIATNRLDLYIRLLEYCNMFRVFDMWKATMRDEHEGKLATQSLCLSVWNLILAFRIEHHSGIQETGEN